MNENVYQHFRREERSFIDMVSEKMERAETYYAPELTEFLDPRECYILEVLVRKNGDLNYQFFGGYETAERKRAMIYPAYYSPRQEDFEISIFEIHYPIKFATLSHSKILGTLLSIGVKREYFGDIITDGERWQIFLANETKHYVATQIEQIGKISVRLTEQDYTQLLLPKEDWEEEMTTLSSLRLDNFISNVYNISRTRAKQLVDSGKVKLNWSEESRSDTQIELMDVISVRGHGRIQLRGIEGKTKKEKIRVTLGVLRK
ncbi:RNA-binding protein YlmH, contains S4-like domain [Pilibacter termitis]|uniref:RNA-binding protein YlmH, contains S4-like domain n=1 Tax=Pilibacter termitis TaxID=263852 RepID=A0A1T4M4G4_9ENTE|nr:RNA-binding protein [Pilibacter termitis]SJZ61890.1 RNA-binding protein YlmH, contains S4-like domain [Pilibacter termitis]